MSFAMYTYDRISTCRIPVVDVASSRAIGSKNVAILGTVGLYISRRLVDSRDNYYVITIRRVRMHATLRKVEHITLYFYHVCSQMKTSLMEFVMKNDNITMLNNCNFAGKTLPPYIATYLHFHPVLSLYSLTLLDGGKQSEQGLVRTMY